jgi:hypothetical protein
MVVSNSLFEGQGGSRNATHRPPVPMGSPGIPRVRIGGPPGPPWGDGGYPRVPPGRDGGPPGPPWGVGVGVGGTPTPGTPGFGGASLSKTD